MILIFNPGGPIGAGEISQAIHSESAKKDITDQSTNKKIRQWIRRAVISGIRENIFDYFIDHFAGILISEALSITGGNRTQAAKLLGLSRPTLQSKIEKYKIKIETSVKNE